MPLTPFKVSDLVPNVWKKLSKRDDVLAEAPRHIRDAIVELTESYAFEHLRTTGPIVNFQIGLCEYPVTAFTNNNESATFIESWFIALGNTGSALGTTTAQPSSNNNGYVLKFRTIGVVEPMSKVSGLPSRWTQWGNNLLLVGNCPDQSYQTYMRYQKAHPWNGDYESLTDIGNNTIFMPHSWRDVVEYAAAERAAIELRMMDYATMYHQLIYGDPEFQVSGGTKGAPGLIFKRQSQLERNMSNNERQLQPRVERYTN